VAKTLRLRPVNRLHQPSEFSAVFQYRRVIRGKLFDLHWRLDGALNDAVASDKLSSARLGLVVPKRLARRAVMRNLMKRIVRENFRQQLADLPAVDLVLKLSRKPNAQALACDCVRPSDPVFRQRIAEDIHLLLHGLSKALEKHLAFKTNQAI